MANTLAVQDVQTSERTKVVIYKLTLSGSYVQASPPSTGEILNLSGASNAKMLPGAFWGLSGPDRMYALQGVAGNSAEFIAGADGQHWVMKLFASSNTELGAGAYNAAVTGDTNILVAAEGPSSH